MIKLVCRNLKVQSLFFLFILVLHSSVFINATAPESYMVITNPGENSNNQMRISWHTDTTTSKAYVEYTKTTDSEWKKSKKVDGNFYRSTSWNGINTRVDTGKLTQHIIINKYAATLEKLSPKTEYMYRIVGKETSEPRYFKTTGEKTFSFAWISDYHQYDPIPKRLHNGMGMVSTLIEKNDGVDFVLSTGDDVAYGGSYSYWKNLFDHDNYKKYMWVTLNGNHDNMDMTNKKNTPNFYRDTHNDPQNGYPGQEGVSYWFKYGNILWIILNTEDLINPAQVPIAQAWAENVIKNNPSKYIFVAQHYQWFNSKNGEYRESGFTRWNKFFDKWGVTLALGGNEHIYCRTLPIYNQEVSTIPGKGTVYIQAPSSDGDRGVSIDTPLTSNTDKIAFRWANGLQTIGGSVVTVSDKDIKIKLYDENGMLIDNAVIPTK